jgi:DNA-binding transcriptional MocR family regulator
VLARKNGAYLLEYGHPFGYLPLREHIVLMLAGLGITASTGQILLTQGTSQALELAIRYLLKPGDAALVDDPGYYNLFGNLRLQGVEMLAVPRNPDGPDVAILEKLAAAHRPKVYFTQSVMQNPTGTDMSPHVAFKVLQAAERHNFTIVEDDIFSDLQVRTTPRLATLDQLNRVIYARSFSKTLSGSLRVGFLACSQDIANELADIKMLTSITTSQFTERLIYLMLVDGHYRKYLSRLHERLGEARLNVVGAFDASGWNCSLSLQTACSYGPNSRTLTTPLRWRRHRNAMGSCLRQALSFVRISNAQRGCGSMLVSAKTSACRIGCSG